MTLSSCHSLSDQGGTHESPAGGSRRLCFTAQHPLRLPRWQHLKFLFRCLPCEPLVQIQSFFKILLREPTFLYYFFLSHQFALDFLHLATAHMFERLWLQVTENSTNENLDKREYIFCPKQESRRWQSRTAHVAQQCHVHTSVYKTHGIWKRPKFYQCQLPCLEIVLTLGQTFPLGGTGWKVQGWGLYYFCNYFWIYNDFKINHLKNMCMHRPFCICQRLHIFLRLV